MNTATLPKGLQPPVRYTALAQALRAARARAGLTQKQAAAAIGVSRATVNSWEQGVVPRTAALIDAARVYGRPANSFPGFSGLRVEAYHPGTVPAPLPAAASPAGGTVNGRSRLTGVRLSGKLRAWVHRFLAELADGGATDPELREAEHLLVQLPAMTRASDGAPDAYSDDELLRAFDALAERLIRPRLRRAGRRV